MITIVTGPPGNGKSLLEQTVTVEEWLNTDRDIVTSTPVRIVPWVTGDGRPMMGLAGYLQTTLKREFPESKIIRPGIVSAGKLLVVEDESELGTLFMWRRDKTTGEWFKLRWDSENEQFNRGDLARIGNGQFIITDEAWKCYSSRRWKDSEKVTEFYGRQHRKFGDDWHLVSHSHKDLDVQINRMAQQWQICTNYGLRRLSIFRQPPVFEVKTFYEPPNSHTARPMHTVIRRLDVRLAQTYDTSAGVAVGGGRAADVRRRRKGISMVWLIVAVVVLLICLAVLPKLMGVMFQGWFKRSIGIKGQPTKAVPAQVVPAVRPQSSVAPVKTVPVAQAITAVSNPPLLKVTGHFFNGEKLTVMLSDGTTRTMRRNYRRNEDGTVILDGKEYQVATVEAGPPLPPLQTKTFAIAMPGTIREKSSQNPVSVTVIGQRNDTPMQTATPAASAHLRE